MEFLALGNHRKPILHEIARYAELFREAEVSAIDRVLRDAGVDVAVFPPAMLSLLVSSISRVNRSPLRVHWNWA